MTALLGRSIGSVSKLASDRGAERAVFRSVLACKAPLARINTVAERVAIGAAAISGGATLFPVTGLWAKDASEDLGRYRGPFEVATGVAIEITVPLDRADELYTALQVIVAEECARHALPARWIHTDIEIHGQRIAAHFRIGTE